MATLAVIPIGRATSALGRMRSDDRGVEGYQVLAVATVVLLVVAPMFAFSGANARNDPIQGSVGGPGGDIQGWEDSLSWMAENTPAEGTYGSPDGDQLEFAGSFPRQDDFDYGSGSYGVVSWWDYGHWITSVGERIPNANPFQQGARTAARFLLARSENEARDALARVEENDAKTRYATIDWKMVETMSFRPVRGKFFAPGTFHPNYSSYNVWTGNEFVEPVAIRSQTRAGLPQIYRHKQAYYESMAVRLYRYHGSAQEPRNFVVDWGLTQQKVDVDDDGTRDRRVNIAPRNGPLLRQFDNRSAAEAFVEEDGTAQIGGIGPYPSERVPALQHYRLVQASDRLADQTSRRFGIGALHAIQAANVTDLLAQQPGYGQLPQQQLGSLAFNWLHPSSTAWTKVFERVPGAEIRGQGPPNSTVTAAVQMQIPTPKPATNFTYTQQAETGPDGEFTMTVPYSTTGYDEWGPENGQTNVSVRATGPYEFRTGLERQPDGNLTYHGGILEVSEAAVIGETDEPLTVTLEEQQPEPARNITVGNQTDGAAGEGGDGAGSDGAGSESLAASPVADGAGTEDGSTESALRDLLAPALRAVAPVARGGA
jgi:dolichyl-diphosphooligosaccharide--protein glycosyltransferase